MPRAKLSIIIELGSPELADKLLSALEDEVAAAIEEACDSTGIYPDDDEGIYVVPATVAECPQDAEDDEE